MRSARHRPPVGRGPRTFALATQPEPRATSNRMGRLDLRRVASTDVAA